MPELPEVETVRRGLEPAMAGNVIASAVVRREGLRIPFPAGLSEFLKGRKVRALTRRAKYLVIHLKAAKSGEPDDLLVIHLGMSGRMTVMEDAKNYQPLKHDHLLLEMQGGKLIAFNDPRRFGMVFIVSEDAMSAHPAFAGMGPEPLSNGFSGQVLYSRLKGKKISIKTALLDQRVVAGVGNIYACEALYEAGIDPQKPASLTVPACETLAAAIKSVLARAIEAGGSSLRDHRQADGSLGYFQHSFAV
ncbi:MAG: DNA-formamidopyrimidine glycosylase, partial [Micavibrio aeruginosavorus]